MAEHFFQFQSTSEMYLIQIFVASLLFIGLRGQNKIKPSPRKKMLKINRDIKFFITQLSEYCAFLENEEFAIDIKRCQNTCSCYGRKWDCDSYRPQGDCYCKDGFARSYENGPCVDVKLDEECAAMLPISPGKIHSTYEKKIRTKYTNFHS